MSGTAVCLVLGAVLSAGCWSNRANEASALAPEVTLEQVRFQIDRGGVSRATGQAGRVTFRRDTTEVVANDLDLVLSGAEGPVRLQAPEAYGVTSSRQYRAVGGVTAQRGTDVAVTPTASYDAQARQPLGLVRGDDPVRVTGQGYQLDGQHFTLDPASGEIVLGGGAKLLTGLPVKP